MANKNKPDPFKEMMSFGTAAPSKKETAPKKPPAEQTIKKNDEIIAKKAEAIIEEAEDEREEFSAIDEETIIPTKKSLSIIGAIVGASVVVFIGLFVLLKALSLVGTEVKINDFADGFDKVIFTEDNLNSPPQGYGNVRIDPDAIKKNGVSTVNLYNGIVLNTSTRNSEILWAEIVCSNSHLVFNADNPPADGYLIIENKDFGYDFYGMCCRLVCAADPTLKMKASAKGMTLEQYACGLVNNSFTFAQNNAAQKESYTNDGVYSYTDSMTSAHISYTLTYYKDGGISFKVSPNTSEENYTIS